MIQDSPVSTDWSQLSSIWQEFPDFQGMDFSNSPMVVDPSMLSKPSIEPDLLSKPHFDYDFPFTFQLQSNSSLSSSDMSSFPRRLSVSSGSGSVSSSSESLTDPAAELAQRVREFAGVMMALPTSPSALPCSISSMLITLCRRRVIVVLVLNIFGGIYTSTDNASLVWSDHVNNLRDSQYRRYYHDDVVAAEDLPYHY